MIVGACVRVCTVEQLHRPWSGAYILHATQHNTYTPRKHAQTRKLSLSHTHTHTGMSVGGVREMREGLEAQLRLQTSLDASDHLLITTGQTMDLTTVSQADASAALGLTHPAEASIQANSQMSGQMVGQIDGQTDLRDALISELAELQRLVNQTVVDRNLARSRLAAAASQPHEASRVRAAEEDLLHTLDEGPAADSGPLPAAERHRAVEEARWAAALVAAREGGEGILSLLRQLVAANRALDHCWSKLDQRSYGSDAEPGPFNPAAGIDSGLLPPALEAVCLEAEAEAVAEVETGSGSVEAQEALAVDAQEGVVAVEVDGVAEEGMVTMVEVDGAAVTVENALAVQAEEAAGEAERFAEEGDGEIMARLESWLRALDKPPDQLSADQEPPTRRCGAGRDGQADWTRSGGRTRPGLEDGPADSTRSGGRPDQGIRPEPVVAAVAAAARTLARLLDALRQLRNLTSDLTSDLAGERERRRVVEEAMGVGEWRLSLAHDTIAQLVVCVCVCVRTWMCIYVILGVRRALKLLPTDCIVCRLCVRA